MGSTSYNEIEKSPCHRLWRKILIAFFAVLLWLIAALVTVINYFFINYAPFFVQAWLIWGFTIGYFVVLLFYVYFNIRAEQRQVPICGQVLVGLSVIPLLISLFISLAFVFPSGETDYASYRIGGVTTNSAKIWIRSPKISALEIVYKPTELSGFAPNDKAFLTFSESGDFTGTASLENLISAQVYDFLVLNNGVQVYSGTFKTAPTANISSGSFSFNFGSCFLESFPYRFGARAKAPQVLYDSFRDLDMFIEVGDLIYADIPVLYGTSEDYFNKKYRQSLTNPGLQRIFNSMPTLHMFGDHEIYNDWTGDANGLFETAIAKSWYNYAGSTNPYASDPRPTDKYWFTYDYGSVSFFFIEAHTNRNYDTKTILGESQKTDLFAWLDTKKNTATFKFIVSPGPWADVFSEKIIKFESSGAWATFPEERAEILDHIVNNNITGCVFLSADKHASYVAKLKNGNSEFYELSVSPLSAFDTTVGGIGSSQFISDDPLDEVLFSIGGRRIGVATSFFGIIRTDFSSATLSFEIWDYYQGRSPSELTLAYTLNLTAANI